MKKRFLFFIVLLVAITVVAGCSSSQAKTKFPQQITIFKSQSCGCCGVYTDYMQKKGFEVQVTNLPSLDQIKTQYGIPSTMQSCHTTAIGEYFVEGHIPLEAIDKLLTEKPSIAGIAMAGMPYGSPGMPGTKQGPFVIYAIGQDGSIAEFMRI